jgi:hypothetical protein
MRSPPIPSPLAGFGGSKLPPVLAEGRMGSARGAHHEDRVVSPPALRATSPLPGED